MRTRLTLVSGSLSLAIVCVAIGVPRVVNAAVTGCCNLSGGTCQNNVDPSACMAEGDTFFLGGSCGTLDPNRCVPAGDSTTCCNLSLIHI